jgi:hypothetical protein
LTYREKKELIGPDTIDALGEGVGVADGLGEKNNR